MGDYPDYDIIFGNSDPTTVAEFKLRHKIIDQSKAKYKKEKLTFEEFSFEIRACRAKLAKALS